MFGGDGFFVGLLWVGKEQDEFVTKDIFEYNEYGNKIKEICIADKDFDPNFCPYTEYEYK